MMLVDRKRFSSDAGLINLEKCILRDDASVRRDDCSLGLLSVSLSVLCPSSFLIEYTAADDISYLFHLYNISWYNFRGQDLT